MYVSALVDKTVAEPKIVIKHTNKSTTNNPFSKQKHKRRYALVRTKTLLHRPMYARRLSKHIICTLAKLYTGLELKTYKILFPKIILHPAPQIKLWGGGDFGILRVSHAKKLQPKTQISLLVQTNG